ncbi:MAG: TrkH family potassium uptake protein [Actinobacteria bacterium]|nr:TrkH family potassium uptake protein [Actinomycetota bacterium]
MHPSQIISLAFTGIILLGTALLVLPIATQSGKSTPVFDALFTATSATTVTGLSTLDVETHWSLFGHVVIALLIQVGGFGIVGFASLVAILLDGRVSLRTRLNANSETGASAPDVKSLLFNVLKIMLFFQVILGGILTWRFATEYGYELNKALAHGAFHAISSFNNAGFALYSDSMIQFARDGWILVPIFTTVFLASLGFPTIVEMRDRLFLKLAKLFKVKASYSMPKQWSLNSRIVLWASFALLAIGTVALAFIEWSNPNTLGPLTPIQKIVDSVFASVMPRTAGFNSLDVSQMQPTSWLVTSILMFIGGASASTAGGIKVGTFVVLLYIVYTEIRGDNAVNVGNRRLPRSMQRQALTIVSLYMVVIVGALLILRFTTGFTLEQLLFEVVSAVGTVGLSTGITAQLPEHAKFLLALLMLFGRLGPIIVATSLALRRTKRHFEYPKERPLIG